MTPPANVEDKVMANPANKIDIGSSDAFESIDEGDLAMVGGGVGLGDLVTLPLTVAQQGLQLVSALDPTGITGRFVQATNTATEQFKNFVNGIFGR